MHTHTPRKRFHHRLHARLAEYFSRDPRPSGAHITRSAPHRQTRRSWCRTMHHLPNVRQAVAGSHAPVTFSVFPLSTATSRFRSAAPAASASASAFHLPLVSLPLPLPPVPLSLMQPPPSIASVRLRDARTGTATPLSSLWAQPARRAARPQEPHLRHRHGRLHRHCARWLRRHLPQGPTDHSTPACILSSCGNSTSHKAK